MQRTIAAGVRMDIFAPISRLLKNGHLLRFPHPSSLQRTAKYASLLRISGALHLALFEQPGKDDFSRALLEDLCRRRSSRSQTSKNILPTGKGSSPHSRTSSG